MSVSEENDLNDRLVGGPAQRDGIVRLTAEPIWRNVLRQIAARLMEADVDYKVVGGASAALHAVKLPVKDVDIEMDAADAYRFQEMFAEQVVTAVELREGEAYRSHFGVFDFEGVWVEVMGDLERWEGERWVSTRCATREWIELDGTPVSVSWLEEEMLAAIRRGRLERAAQYLVKCDRVRLLALLRGEERQGVL